MFSRRAGMFFGVVSIAVLLVFIFRSSLLESVSGFLICPDELGKADVMVVLSGGAFDRGNYAAKLFEEGYTSGILCTGKNSLSDLKVFGIDTAEAYLTAANLKLHGIADSVVVIIPEGTSTREEGVLLRKYCDSIGVAKLLVVTSLLHTRRAGKVIRKAFQGSRTKLIIAGAPSSKFDETRWWKSEDGLIAINNEWLKTIYYWVKY